MAVSLIKADPWPVLPVHVTSTPAVWYVECVPNEEQQSLTPNSSLSTEHPEILCRISHTCDKIQLYGVYYAKKLYTTQVLKICTWDTWSCSSLFKEHSHHFWPINAYVYILHILILQLQILF